MAGFGDLLGSSGVIEQLLLWGVVNQVVTAVASPAFLVLAQDISAKHPEVVLDPATLASAVARGMVTEAVARADAAKSGVAATRFDVLRELAAVRVDPASLATAVLRGYLTPAQAQAQATPQGVSPADMAILTDLAGDAPGADQLVMALRRGIIARTGRGPNSTSYEQGIAETRLHNKWGDMIDRLSETILSPPELADAVVRNFMTTEVAQKIAAQNGMSAADLAILTHLSGDAPGPQQLAEALRRGLVPEAGTGAGSTSFTQGIAEGRLADKWAPVIKGLSTLWPTPADALRATLQGQVPLAEGRALYTRLGGDPQFFQVMFDAEGSSPTPLQLIEMANRGIIGWSGTGPAAVSYEQGFLEGPWRDKWSAPYKALGEFVPPISAVTGLLSHGAITTEQASALLAKQGMSAELIAAYIEEAHLTQLSAYRGLSQGVALDAYKAHLIDAEQLRSILTSLHVTAEAADLLIEYADFQHAYTQLNSAVSRIRSLYAARKITHVTAHDALILLGISGSSVPTIMAEWSLENSISVKVLTEAQIVDAVEYGIITPNEGLAELNNIGYTPFDAWLLMSVKAKVPLPDKPEPGAPARQDAVIAGTT